MNGRRATALAWTAARVARLHAGGMHVLDLCYPRRCEGCGSVPELAGRHLCWRCMAGAEYIMDPMCSCCGDPVSGAVEHRFECGWCGRTRPAFDAARSAVRFRGSLKNALHRYKYNQAVYLAADLAILLEGCVNAHYGGQSLDAIAYVPLHPRKARDRGYNQARLLAAVLGRRLGLPVVHRALERIHDTQTQTRLKAEARKANVRGAFRTRQSAWVDGRHWLLVDDVMTTGATVNECAHVLKQHRASSVRVVTVARG